MVSSCWALLVSVASADHPSMTGTGVHVAASFVKPSNFSVKIDDGSFQPQYGNGTFDSPTLPDGKHTITYAMSNLTALPAFDYLSITAGPSTPLQGKTISVDDTDNALVYSGSWTKSSPYPVSFDYAPTLYQNTSHWASKVGDTMQYQFEGSSHVEFSGCPNSDVVIIGTSVAIYGIVAYNSTSPRNITASYNLDGVTQTRTISNTTMPYLPMAELFHADVQPGNHTLIFNITDIQGERALGIDFIAYNASFNALAPPPPSNADASVVPDWAPKVGISLAAIAGFAFFLTIGLIFWQRFRKDRHLGKKYVPSA